MTLKLFLIAALFFNFCFPTNASGQILKDPNFNLKPRNWKKETITYSPIQAGILGKAELIGKNQRFDIYKLPLDNMPCITPNAQFWQNNNSMRERFGPGKELDTNNNMPNPFRKQELIPPGK